MRTIMMLGGVVMIGSGVFCVANGSAAFITLAFIIGVVFCLMGAIELVIGTRASFEIFGNGVTITTDGAMMLLFGAVVLAGQVGDDNSALMLFALWLLIESIESFGKDAINVTERTTGENLSSLINVVMLIFSVFMFFNNRLLNIGSILLIGIGMVLLGLVRILKSFYIEYDRPGFLTGNQERLEEAIDEEKRALAKAKEGIREQKEARRRIEKIRKDMAKETSMLEEAKLRKQYSDNEKNR